MKRHFAIALAVILVLLLSCALVELRHTTFAMLNRLDSMELSLREASESQAVTTAAIKNKVNNLAATVKGLEKRTKLASPAPPSAKLGLYKANPNFNAMREANRERILKQVTPKVGLLAALASITHFFPPILAGLAL